VNKEKRHAFVKMYYRKDAERAKTAMEDARTQDYQLRVSSDFRFSNPPLNRILTRVRKREQTRWGVGFGPRDCSDYQSGISVIPIHKLTEADRKWMLTAPFGGSGGRPIVTGLCVEEPDIEIGAGVSSKAISRRMQTDKGGNHGPKSSRRAEDEPAFGHGPGGRWRHGRDKHHGSGGGGGGRDQRRGGGGGGAGDDRADKAANNDEPIVVGLPAGITMGPNGITYPPNFTFGTAASNQ
jgi:protein NRD1